MISAILGGATAIASGISAIQNFQQAKVDSQAAAAAANRLMGLQEQNKMAALQAPDISSLKSQQNAQQAATATQALQGMGAEGAANVANLYQASLQDQAQTAQDQAAMNAEVEQIKAQSAQGVEMEAEDQMNLLQELKDGKEPSNLIELVFKIWSETGLSPRLMVLPNELIEQAEKVIQELISEAKYMDGFLKE